MGNSSAFESVILNSSYEGINGLFKLMFRTRKMSVVVSQYFGGLRMGWRCRSEVVRSTNGRDMFREGEGIATKFNT